MSKNILFNFFVFSFLFGVFLNNIFLSVFLSIFIFCFFTLIFWNFYIYTKKYLVVFLFIFLWFFLWIFLSFFYLKDISKKQDFISSYLNNQNHKLVFEIKDINKIEDFSKHYLAELIEINGDKTDENIFAVLIIPSNLDLHKGNIISSQSKLFEFDNFKGFDYRNYLLSKKIFFKSYFYDINIIKHNRLNSFERYIKDFRQLFLSTIKKIYPNEEGIFLWWILIWARENLPTKLKTHFNNSWLTHFIAVSGFNITILIIFFTYILRFFPLFLRIILITLSITIFTILVWDTAPVLRASIMWLIWYYVMSSGRKWSSLSIILLTIFIMILLSPLSLNYDVSLHLSFLAVIWIVYTQDFFKKIFYFLPEMLAIKEAFVLTLGALSFTLPIMIFNFGQLSILSPIANVLVAWTIPIAMLLWFLSIIFYLLSPILWYIIWYLTWVFLKWDIIIVHFFWQIDLAILKLDFWVFKNYFEILYFIILVFLIIYSLKEKIENWEN